MRQVRQAVDAGRCAVDIEVDGGIDVRHGARAAAAGANVFVAGSAIFGHERPWEAADAIREAVVRARGSGFNGMFTAWRVSFVTQANCVNSAQRREEIVLRSALHRGKWDTFNVILPP